MSLETFLTIDKENFVEPVHHWGDHPLHYLAKLHMCDELECCFTMYGDIDVRNAFQQTPLLSAAHSLFVNEYPYNAEKGFVETFHFLINHGADIAAKDIRGWTALKYIMFNFVAIYSVYNNEYFYGRMDLDESFQMKQEVVKLFVDSDYNHFKELMAFPPIVEALKVQDAKYSTFLHDMLLT